MATDFLTCPGAPWHDEQTGRVIWVDHQIAESIPGLHVWARWPLWIDDLSNKEFPLSSLLPFSPLLFAFLPSAYVLTDNTSRTDAVQVGREGLYFNNQCLRWQDCKSQWPAIVAHASAIDVNTPSPLMAMAIWLNRLPMGSVLPCYQPAGMQIDDVNQIRPVALNCYCTKQVNRQYLAARAREANKNRFARKWRKFKTRPVAFFQDSKWVKKIMGR